MNKSIILYKLMANNEKIKNYSNVGYIPKGPLLVIEEYI